MRILLFLFSVATVAISARAELEMEKLDDSNVWVDPRIEKVPDQLQIRATIWFDQQLLGDGKAFSRRAEEFGDIGRTELRKQVVAALKAASATSEEEAKPILDELDSISDVEFHWIERVLVLDQQGGSRRFEGCSGCAEDLFGWFR